MAAATLRAQLNRFRPQLGDLVTSIVVAVYLLLFLNVTFWSKAGLYLKNDPSAYAALWVAIFALFAIGTVAVSIKYIIKPVLILYIAVATAAAWFTDTYGVFVDTDMVRNAFETTKAETQDLLTPGLISERDEHPTFPFAIAAARTAPSPIGAERDGRRSR